MSLLIAAAFAAGCSFVREHAGPILPATQQDQTPSNAGTNDTAAARDGLTSDRLTGDRLIDSVGSAQPPGDEPAAAPSRGTSVNGALADGEWVHRIAPPDEATANEGPMSKSRWRHAGLDRVLSRADARQRLRAAARLRDVAVSANAAIGLAWTGDESALSRLNATARDSNFKLPARAAAIEAIAQLDTPQADDALAELFEEYGDFGGAARSRYLPELHEELVHAAASRTGDRHAEALRAALTSPASAVRLEAAKAYLGGRRALPRELVDRAADDAAPVRAVAVRALADAKHEQAQSCARRALGDYDLAVRLAAIAAIGLLPAPENVAQLNGLANDTSDLVRAAAIAALADRGETSAVVQAVNDKSWRVRAAAAERLFALPAEDREPLARALIADASLEVQRRMVRALHNWPLAEAIPLLLDAIDGPTAATRRDAAAQLQTRWPLAADLSPQAPRERMAAQAAKLRELWQQEPAAHTPQHSRGRTVGALTNATVAFDEPTIAKVLERLAAPSLQARRAAARELALNDRESRLPIGVLLRLRELLERELDSLVWSDVLLLIADDDRAPAADLAVLAASHPHGEIRRRACAYFGEHPSARAVELLLNSLADDDITVVREAARALGTQSDVPEIAPLEALLTATDSGVRLEAARALARLGSPAGARAILRLTYHHDASVRRQAAAALGTAFQFAAGERGTNRDDGSGRRSTGSATGDPLRRAAIADLVRLLDDQGDVRRAALASLRAIAGELPPEASNKVPAAAPASNIAGSDDEIRRWKEWDRAESAD